MVVGVLVRGIELEAAGINAFESKADATFSLVFEGKQVVGHAWVQGESAYLLSQYCPDDERSCLIGNAEAVRAVSVDLPGAPQTFLESSGFSERSVGAAFFTIWILFVGIGRLVGVLRRESFETVSVPPHVDVQPLVGKERRLRVLRRVAGVVAVGSLLLAGLAATSKLVAGDDDGSLVAIGIAAVWGLAAGFVWLRARRRALPLHLERRAELQVVGSSGLLGLFSRSAAHVGLVVLGLLFLALVIASVVQGVSTATWLESFDQAAATPGPAGAVKSFSIAMVIAYQYDPVTLVMLGFGLSVLMIGGLDRLGQRLLAASAREVLERDERPPVLYLRSFDEDRLYLPATWSRRGLIARLSPIRRRRFEEVLVTLMDQAGPVVAVSPPGTRLAPLGAARITLSNDEWQDQVRQWAGQSQMLVLGATPSEIRDGYRWELELVSQHLPTRPLLLVLAPHRRRELHRRFGLFLRQNWPWVHPLARVPDGILVAGHVPGVGWRAFGARRRTDATYAVAMKECLDWVSGATPGTVPSGPA
jgi:hypothetical protein